MIASVYPELFALLEHGKLKKTLKAFKKETGVANIQKLDGTNAEKLIESLLLLRKRQKNVKVNCEESEVCAKYDAKSGSMALTTAEDSHATEHVVKGISAKKDSANVSKEKENQKLSEQVAEFLRGKKRQRSKSVDAIQEQKRHKSVNAEYSTVNESSSTGPRRSSMSATTVAPEPLNNEPLKRLNVPKLLQTVTDSRLLDQSYASKNGDNYAAKAAEELGRVRGKDFRREMHKKKRASWKGLGHIEDKINSIQFDSD